MLAFVLSLLSVQMVTADTNQSMYFENVTAYGVTTSSIRIAGWTNITTNVSATVNGVEYTDPLFTNYFDVSVTGLSSGTNYYWNVTAYAEDNQSVSLFNGTYNTTTLDWFTNQSIGLTSIGSSAVTNQTFQIDIVTNISTNATAVVDGVVQASSTGTTHAIAVTGLTDSTIYYWNVTLRATDNQTTNIFNGTFSVLTTPSTTASNRSCQNTQSTIYTAFGLIALFAIVGAAFGIINIFSTGNTSPGTLMALSIAIIGLAIVIFVGFVIIDKVGTSICVPV